MMNNPVEIGLYIHIPFCLCKCSYCDFPSFSKKDEYYQNYVEVLIKEIDSYYLDNLVVKTVFIGGGTPTVLPPNLLEKILGAVTKYNLHKDCEITIEANPETLSMEYTRHLKKIGFNRLSIGLQSTNNKILKSIGRIHNFEKFYEEYNNSIKVGFNNINVDLMFSLPNQTLEIYKDTLETVSSLAPTHISAYSLILEENTPMYHQFHNNNIDLPSEDYDRKLYEMTYDILSKNGYKRYEISNYSKENYECKHNLSYWQQIPYLGFGLGAHSFYNNKRYNNTYDFNNYISGNNKIENVEVLSKKSAMEEFMFLGLRITDGISISNFEEKFSSSIDSIYSNEITNLVNNGLLKIKNDNLSLTNKGIDLSNYVFSKFII